jgi:excisionase family DNA binding protein
MEKEFYTVKELANILDVSNDRVYEWLRSGYIKGTRPMPHSAWRAHKTEVSRLRGEVQKQAVTEQE